MASKLSSDCQLEGTVCGRTTWLEFILIVLRRSKAFHPAAVQAASKLDLLSPLSSRNSRASSVGSPTPPAKERPDLHSSTRAQSGGYAFHESDSEDGTTDEECSNMEIEYISLLKLKRKIRRADLTGDQVFLCCLPRPAVPVHQMYKMQDISDNDGLSPFDASCLFEYINGQASTMGRKQSTEIYLRIDPGETIKYASIRMTIHRGYTLTKLTQVNWMKFEYHPTSYIDLAKFDHPPVHMERVACW